MIFRRGYTIITNTTLYDFGYLDIVTFFDNYIDLNTSEIGGYGTYEDLSIDIPDLYGGFYQATPDADASNLLI